MNQITLNQVISGHNLTWEERVEYFNMMKNFLLTHCRKGSKMYNAIDWAWFENMQEYGIFNRLCIYNGRATYIAGQDYTYEINTVKKCFIK